jgi:hypothetical protein
MRVFHFAGICKLRDAASLNARVLFRRRIIYISQGGIRRAQIYPNYISRIQSFSSEMQFVVPPLGGSVKRRSIPR